MFFVERLSYIHAEPFTRYCIMYMYVQCRAEQPDYGDLLRIPEPQRIDKVVDEDSGYAVFVSFVEIYNNYVYDLLEDTPTDSIRPKYVLCMHTV